MVTAHNLPLTITICTQTIKKFTQSFDLSFGSPRFPPQNKMEIGNFAG